MAQASRSISEEERNILGAKLTRELGKAMEEKIVSEEEASEIASLILSKIDTLSYEEDLLNFLQEISNKWSFFSNVLVLEKGEIKEEKEDQVASKVENLIKNNKLEDALKMAEEATTEEKEVNNARTNT